MKARCQRLCFPSNNSIFFCFIISKVPIFQDYPEIRKFTGFVCRSLCNFFAVYLTKFSVAHYVVLNGWMFNEQ